MRNTYQGRREIVQDLSQYDLRTIRNELVNSQVLDCIAMSNIQSL